MNHYRWRIAYYLLLAGFLAAALLNVLRMRAGFLTNHLADLVVPAWLYVAMRGLHSTRGRVTLLQREFGRTPEIAALTIFAGSALTEVSQIYWPRGLFAGRFDAWDIAAYGAGIVACYVADKRSA